MTGLDTTLKTADGKSKDYLLKHFKKIMKKLFIYFFILASGIVSSQTSLLNNASIGASGGLFLPYSSETLKTGVSLGIEAQYKIAPSYLFFDMTYNFSDRKSNIPSEYYNNTSSSGLFVLSGGIRLYIAETRVKYFVDCGLGLYAESKGSYIIKSNGITTSHPSESNGTVGGNIGFGATYPLNSDFDFIGKIKYHLYFGVGEDPFLNTYFGISAGVKYNIKL
jgi:hypothetical protein